MPLLNILSSLAADLGISLSVDSERAFLVQRINDVAREKYRENDLKFCEREQLFEFGQFDQQVALPQYVEKVIAARDYTTRLPMTQLDMRPRYMSNYWRQPFLGYPYFKWRLKGISPLKRDITSSGPLTISLPSANSALFSVVITGETANAKRTQEVVLFQTTDTEKTTSNQFSSIESIRKSAVTDVDVSVKDINSTEIAVIPNTEDHSEYKILQVLDRNEYPSSSMLMEILYKTRYIPFQNDYDQFPCGDMYDEALYWATLAKIYSAQDGKEDKVTFCHNKAEASLARIALNVDAPVDCKIKFGKNQVFHFFSRKGQSISTASPYRPYYSNSLK